MPDQADQWRGGVDVTLKELTREVRDFIIEMRDWKHTVDDEFTRIKVSEARSDGRIEGGKAVFLAIGTVLGAAISGLIAWLKH